MKLFWKLQGQFLVLFFILFTSYQAYSQNYIRCLTDEMEALRLQNDPSLEGLEGFEEWMAESVQFNQSALIVGGVYQIPVVVHVIHNGEAVGSGSNISLAAIQSQIDVLNEDFRKILGTNGYNTHPSGADTQIEFCLAKRRPDGSAFPNNEDGVNRINRSTAGFTAPPFTTNYINATIKPWTYNNNNPTATRGWSPDRYFNIWVCDISGGILGYAQFPESPLGGMGCGAQSAATDGVVLLYNSVGKSVISGFPAPYNEGRTATHEVGHWLGLRHIWGDGGCTVDDFCNDTPLAGAANYGCPTGTNSCTAAPDAGPDMIENYMDYTDDLCMNIFTYDQKMRMRIVLEASPRRALLINSDACVPPNNNDAAITNVFNPLGDNCVGSIIPSVQLRNRGSNNLTSATINYRIDNGTVTTFSWTGSLTPGSSATVALPAFTTVLGPHTFKSWPTMPNGVVDPSPDLDTSSIEFMVSNGIEAPYNENFDGGVFPPDIRWVVNNPNSDCYEWVGAAATSISGVLDNVAAQMPSFGNSTGQTENLITPIFVLPCNATAANIQFDVAYRRRNNTTANYERLYIEISENCGTTWNATPIYDKTGTTLQTVTTTQTTYFTPTAGTQWRTETVDLLPFVTSTSKNIKFRIRAVAANGNNIYIDNFRFNATTPGEIDVTLSSVNVLDGGFANLGSVSAGTQLTGTFTITNSGTTNLTLTGPVSVTGTGFTLGSTFGTTTVPAGGSTTFTVNFYSATGGTFTGNVSFGTNDCDESTFNFEIYATATTSPPVAEFAGVPTIVCAGSAVTFTNLSSGAASYSWTFAGGTPATSTATNPTITYNAPGSYNVTLVATNAFGSDTETKTSYILVVDANGVALPISEGFTGATFVPVGWSLINNNSSPTTWARSATIGVAPTSGNSMFFDNFNYNDSDDDQVHLPGANFTGLVSAQLQFSVAYAAYSAANVDGLEVLVSDDCGATWNSVYMKTGSTVAAGNLPTAAATTTLFTPTAAQWRTETVDLTPYVGNSKVIVAFKNLSGYGNRLFVDNINLTGVLGATPPVASFSASPTTVCAGQTVTFTNSSTGSPTSYSWSFPGGTPATSTATNPTVTYATPGVYDVTLIATNAGGSDTEILTGYITVNAAPSTPGVISGTTTVCSGSTGNAYSITAVPGATSYTWTAPAGATITAGQGTTSATINMGSTSGNVIVTATNSCGTSSAATLAITVNSAPATPGAISGSPSVCPGSSGNVYSISAVSGASSYNWTVPTGATITSGAGTNSITVTFGSNPGNITVTATNSCGTSAAASLSVSLSGTAPATPGTISGPSSVCASQTESYSIAAVTGAINYTWTVPTGASIVSGQGTTAITVNFGASSGNITVNAFSSCGTSPNNSQAITVNAIPASPSVSVTDACGVSTLTATGTGSFVWSTAETTASITVSNSGSYTVTQTVNGCTSTPAVVNASPLAIPTPPTTSVSNSCGNSVLSAAGSNLLWSTGETSSSITVTSQGTYTVTQTVGGCTSSSASVFADPSSGLPTPVVSVTNGCGTSVLTSNATESVVWSTGETTSSIVVMNPGTYTVVQSNGLCTSSAGSATANPLNVPSAPSVSALDACGSSTLTAIGDNLQWSTSESGSTVTVTTAGTYFVSQTVNGCTSPVAEVIANPLAVPAVTFTPLADVCVNDPAFELSGGSPSGGVYTGTGVVGNSFDPSVSGAGTFLIYYEYTDGNGCSNLAHQPITVGCVDLIESQFESFVVYPNPSNGIFHIKQNSKEPLIIEIFDQTGRMVVTFDINTDEFTLDLSEQAEGMYSLVLTKGQSVQHEKLVINK
jgi:PKD repeat protein